MLFIRYQMQSRLVYAAPLSLDPVFVARIESTSENDTRPRLPSRPSKSSATWLPRSTPPPISCFLVKTNGKYERHPDEDLRLQFEAVSRLEEEQKRVVRSLLEGMILRHEALRWQTVSNGSERN